MKTSVSRGLLSLLLVVTLVTIAVSPFALSTAHAQGGGCPLAPEDCALLAAAAEASDNISSVNVKSFNLDLAGGMGDQQSSLSVTGFGPIVFDEANDMFAIDLTFTSATLTTPDETQTGPGAFRVVDGSVYYGKGEGDAIEWQGTALDSGDAQSQLDDLGLDINDIQNFPLMEALQSLNNLPGVVTWSRGEDMTLEDGHTVAVFTFDVSLAALVGSQEFINALSEALLPLVGELGSGSGGGDLFSDPSTISFILSLVLSQLSDQLSASTAQLSVWISPDDSLIYGLSSVIDVTLDLGFLTSLAPNAGGSSTSAPSGPITFSLNFQSVLDQHNGTFTIEAPAEFEPLDTSALNFDLSNILDDAGISLGGLGGGDAAPAAPTAETAEFDIAAGQETTGALSDSNPNDLYRFEGAAGSEVTITMKKTDDSSNLDPYLKLYDAEGNLLTENDDAIETIEDLGFLDSQIAQFTLPSDGVYVIEVSALFIPDNGAYSLLVETN